MTEPLRPLDAQSILGALADGGVEYIVVGGLAVGAHGHPRATMDVDIVPSPEPENLARLAAVLVSLEYEIAGAEEFDPDDLIKPDLDGLLGGGSWVLLTKHGGLDIFQRLEPDLGYAELEAKAIEDRVFGLPVKFCGYDHLVAMKEAASRPQDVADLQALREIRSGQ